MKCLLIIAILTLIPSARALTNDGSFYTRGNQLFPANETQISLLKEVLHLKKVRHDNVEVSVYYEFYNPSERKEIIVGFEAAPPAGDLSRKPINGKPPYLKSHPYIKNFNILTNSKKTPFKIAYVTLDDYRKSGIERKQRLSSIMKSNDYYEYYSFMYVYYFKAIFEPGLNIIKHSYVYSISSSIEATFDFEYILTACNRWANNKIDDFTLIIDPGNLESFNVESTFFESDKEWSINGVGNLYLAELRNEYSEKPEKLLRCNIRSGSVVFHKRDFHPKGELRVFESTNYKVYDTSETVGFDHTVGVLPLCPLEVDRIEEPIDETSKKILRNLPFARRGMIFKDKDLLKYYTKKVDWYIPDSTYTGELNILTREEIEWVEKYK